MIENSFQAARYLGGDHIAAHDDKYAHLLRSSFFFFFSVGSCPASRAFKTIDDEVYSRELAVIYYLTDDWKEEYGGTRRASHHAHHYFGCVTRSGVHLQRRWSGLLEDLEGGKTYVPEFNSLVAFNVPRDHVVTPVTGTRYALASYSPLLGWPHATQHARHTTV